MPIVVGELAPDFCLSNQHGEPVTRDDLVGAPTLLVFFPLVLTPVCEQELTELASHATTWRELGARVVAISVDHRYSLREAADRLHVDFDLLSDFWPHGRVAGAFGAFDQERGHATRSTFVLDDATRVSAIVTSDRVTPRNVGDYVTALQRIE